jgi:hypothetical protein
MRNKIMGNLSPDILLIWFRFIIPAQSDQERAGLLSGFKKMAPAAFFEQVIQLIKTVLAEKEFDTLMKAL